MEGLLLLLALFFFGGWIFGIAGFARAGAARREARALRAEVTALRGEVGGMAGALVAAGFRPPETAAPAPTAEAPMPAAARPPWGGAAEAPPATPTRPRPNRLPMARPRPGAPRATTARARASRN